MANFPIRPAHPERICWGCEQMCPADDMSCGNGTIRSPHPIELMGDDWYEFTMERESMSAVVKDPVAASNS